MSIPTSPWDLDLMVPWCVDGFFWIFLAELPLPNAKVKVTAIWRWFLLVGVKAGQAAKGPPNINPLGIPTLLNLNQITTCLDRHFVPHSKRDVSQTFRVHSVLENLKIGPTSQQLVPLHKTYESSWNRWCCWCSGQQIDLLSSSINDIIFLTVFNGGLEYHILNVFRFAISSTHLKIDGFSVGQYLYQHTWNVDVKYIISLEKTALCHLKYLKKLAMQINRHEHFFPVLTKIKNSVPWNVIDNI